VIDIPHWMRMAGARGGERVDVAELEEKNKSSAAPESNGETKKIGSRSSRAAAEMRGLK